jgi:hypothetical protein
MPKYIVLNNNIVENTILADSLEIAETVTGKTCIEFPSEDFLVHMGDSYDGTSFVPDRNGPERYAPFVPTE